MAMREASGPRGARTNLGPRVAFQIVPAAQVCVEVWGVEVGGVVIRSWGQEALVFGFLLGLARPRFSHLAVHTSPHCPHTPAQAQPPQTDTLQRVAGAILEVLVLAP